MTLKGRKMISAGITEVLALALLTACAIPASQSGAAAPEPCTDATYVQLRRQHPDSLSERNWQRLLSLDRECARARREAASDMTGQRRGAWRGIHHDAVIGVGIMTAVMAAMMLTMW